MFRCPKCHAELPADAKFCTHCGFNQTNARIAAVKEQGGQAGPSAPGRTPNPISQTGNLAQNPGSSPRSHAPVVSPPPQGQGDALQGPKSLPLTQRYRPEPHSGNLPPTQRAALPNTPLPPQMSPQGPQQSQAQGGQGQGATPVVRTSTPPAPSRPPSAPLSRPPTNPLSTPHANLWDGPSLDELYEEESMMIVSKAAQHWRSSWRSRQKAEAGPAVGISRGQAAVPEPLLAMQHSIARMRAVLTPDKKEGALSRSKGPGFWIPLVLLLVLIGGLAVYISTTFSKNGSTATLAAPGAHPLVGITGSATTTFKAGESFKVIGNGFSPDSTVSFSLANGANESVGTRQTARTDQKGRVTTTLTIPDDALAGTYLIKGESGSGKDMAFMPIHVLPTSLTSNTTSLEQTGDTLQFKVSLNKLDPVANGKRVTLSNPTDTPVSWSAATFSDYVAGDPKKPIFGDTMNWLVINDGQSSGQLQGQGKIDIGISANALGLKPSPTAYKGYLVISTVDAQNRKGQLLIKAELLLTPAKGQVVVTPSSNLLLTRQGDGTCKPTTITLANLGTAPVNYTVKISDDNYKRYFQFDNQEVVNGNLEPAGDEQHADVKAVVVTCNGIQVGATPYKISVYTGQLTFTLVVSVQAG